MTSVRRAIMEESMWISIPNVHLGVVNYIATEVEDPVAIRITYVLPVGNRNDMASFIECLELEDHEG